MRTTSALLLLVLLGGYGLSGCSDSTAPENTGRIALTLDLQPAADLGYTVSWVAVTVFKSGTVKRQNLTVNGNSATGTIGDLPSGQYQVTIKVHAGRPVLASGVGTMSTSGKAAQVSFVEWDDLFPELPRTALFVGNSLTNWNGGVGLHFETLTTQTDSNLVVTVNQHAPGGWSLQDHWEDEEQSVVNAIGTGNWQLVVLQPSPSAIINHREEFDQTVRDFSQLIRNNGGVMALIIPHSYAEDPPDYADDIASAVVSIGDQTEAILLPMNQTWVTVQTDRPDLELYHEELYPVHQSPLGTYLYLCVAYATLLELNPEDLTYVNDQDISNSDRNYIQTTAWQTVRSFLEWDGK